MLATRSLNIGRCRTCGQHLRSPAISVRCPKGCVRAVILQPVKFALRGKPTKCGSACEKATTRHCDCVCGGRNHGRKSGHYIHADATKPRKVVWPAQLWHGTSVKGLAKLRASRSTRGLYLTDDENTAYEYAENAERIDRSPPVIIEVDVAVLRKAGGSIAYDTDDDEDILEQLLYKGPLPPGFVRGVESLKGDAEIDAPVQEAPPDPFELATKSFLIAVNRQAALVEDLARLAKRAKRIGAPPITWAFGAVVHRTIKVRDPVTDKYREIQVPFIKMTLTGARPRIAGWEFVATLRHLDGVNLLRKCPAAYEREIPAKFRTRGPTCDHCNQDRRRNDTYILVSDKGVWKQVGSSCLVDFLGHKNPHEMALYAEMLAAAMELAESAEDEEGSFGGGGRSDSAYSLVTFLTYVAAEIREGGWVPKSAHDPEGGKFATVYGALDRLDPQSPVRPRDRSVLPIDKALAEASAEWAQNLEASGEAGKSDYLWNVYAAAKSGTVSHRTTGIAASIVAAYAKMDAARKAPPNPSGHVGCVGDDGAWKVTLTRHSSFDTQYGTSHIYVMRADDGNLFKWMTSKGGEMTQGETYIIAGTIKKHDDYKGVKETQLTRCAVHPFSEDKLHELSTSLRFDTLKKRVKAGAASPDDQAELEALKAAQKQARKLLPKGPPKPPPAMKYYVKSSWTYLTPSEDELRQILVAGAAGTAFPWTQVRIASTGYKQPKPGKMTAIFDMGAWASEHYQRTLGELDSLPPKKATATHFSLALRPTEAAGYGSALRGDAPIESYDEKVRRLRDARTSTVARKHDG